MRILLLTLLLVSCKVPVEVGDPSYIYNVTYSEYFVGTGADVGVEFDVKLFDCIDGFIYNEGDTTTSIGTCDPDIYTRVEAVKE
ncbi:MAG: hypothetical protein KJO69_01655 [Gammaproteobacteria bacterium]|nr:hypothetical protein [Gammaproteobacteria bacterium]